MDASKNEPPLREKEIDINTASKEDLIRLPMMGPVITGRINEYREYNGPFQRVENLTWVKGIGEVTLAEIRKYVRVETIQRD